MNNLFEETKIKSLTLKNRFVRSATHAGLASEDGLVTEQLLVFLKKLAMSDIGLIISGHAYVHELGKASPRQLGVYSDECLAGLVQMSETVHSECGKIVLQIAHAGVAARSRFLDVAALDFSKISSQAINDLVEDFTKAACRAKAAGFDGIQLHCAHGYLISQSLSLFFNKRSDEYGGSVENRARFLKLIVSSIREVLGSDFPLLIKLNSEDFVETGFSQDEMLEVCAILEKAGVDAVELSGGTLFSGDFMPIRKIDPIDQKDEGYYLLACKRYKEKINLPLITVGGFRSYAVCQKVIESNICDYAALSRPLIREVNLIKRWKTGDCKRAACISCNLCMRPVMTGKGLYCVQKKREGKR